MIGAAFTQTFTSFLFTINPILVNNTIAGSGYNYCNERLLCIPVHIRDLLYVKKKKKKSHFPPTYTHVYIQPKNG